MAEGTKIEWTQATWNPTAGCSIYSPGCTHCYAMRQAGRLEAMGQEKYAGLTQVVNGNRVWTGKVRLWPQDLRKPLDRCKPTTWFVDSMSDLFHEGLSDEDIDRVFAVMALARQHTFQVLTKRADRMQRYISHSLAGYRVGNLAFVDALRGLVPTPEPAEAYRSSVWPLPNVHLGVSVENQGAADQRIPHLVQTPAAVRFLSCEPLLGPVQFRREWLYFGFPDHITADGRAVGGPRGIHWVIAGGESGLGARPCHPDWARGLRDQCHEAGVPFFWKQWGEWLPYEPEAQAPYWRTQDGRSLDGHAFLPDWDDPATGNRWDDGLAFAGQEAHAIFERVGKKSAGRLLDGREWNEIPEVTRA